MPLLLRAPQDFEDADAIGPGMCPTCGEWLVRYVPYCAICRTPKEVSLTDDRALDPKEKCTETVRLAHLSDLHLGRPLAKRKPIDVLRIWLGAFADAGTDVVVVSGDILQRASDLRSLRMARIALDESGLPFVVVPGNHDVGKPGLSGAFEDVFGAFPRVERHRGITFALLDSNAGLPPDERRRHERLIASVACFVEGRVGPEQLSILDRELEDIGTDPRVMVLHHHLVAQAGRYVRLGLMAPLQDAHVVRRWATSRGILLALHGHHHVMRRAGVHGNGLVVLNGGSSTLVGPPYRARLVDILPGGNRRVIPVELRL